MSGIQTGDIQLLSCVHLKQVVTQHLASASTSDSCSTSSCLLNCGPWASPDHQTV